MKSEHLNAAHSAANHLARSSETDLAHTAIHTFALGLAEGGLSPEAVAEALLAEAVALSAAVRGRQGRVAEAVSAVVIALEVSLHGR